MAVVRAQAKSAQTSVNYIKTVGFDSNNFTRNVDFAYTTRNSTTGEVQNNVLTVPFLTLVPIPFIRVSGCVQFEFWVAGLCGCSLLSALPRPQ